MSPGTHTDCNAGCFAAREKTVDPGLWRILLNSEDTTLVHRFARLDRTEVRKQLKDAQEDARKYPGSMATLLQYLRLSDPIRTCPCARSGRAEKISTKFYAHRARWENRKEIQFSIDQIKILQSTSQGICAWRCSSGCDSEGPCRAVGARERWAERHPFGRDPIGATAPCRKREMLWRRHRRLSHVRLGLATAKERSLNEDLPGRRGLIEERTQEQPFKVAEYAASPRPMRPAFPALPSSLMAVDRV